MPRKINDKLLTRLTDGDLNGLLNAIKSDDALSLEVRCEGKAFVYYKKCKILEIGPRSFGFDEKYFKRKSPQSLIPHSKEYMSTAPKDSPSDYFRKTKEAIDGWLIENKHAEFKIQQRIARDNRESSDKYVILDMEYQFAQCNILKCHREKSGCYDLLGIERSTGQVILFEVKHGLSALEGASGIADHIRDFRRNVFGEGTLNTKTGLPVDCATHKTFRKQFKADIVNIIGDKHQLGLIDYCVPANLCVDDVKFVFVFSSDKLTSERAKYESIFHTKSQGQESEYPTIFIDATLPKLKLCK